ncbi:hypothetical protein ODZ83_09305 [Acaricomes phytoseiuli]|uniref:hypothetical protein n=1 Tax=Acaricomes phytoseiuli TaxID=291968 RepID=UPI0003785BAE|nr:hypothetical protein [Acaricomes phytoseiuli]MCW1250372.1 hypothetical protein [Acaricomes phytoseiuli]
MSGRPRNRERGKERDRATRTTEHLETAIGFLGFWGVVLVVVIIWQQFSGQNAVGWSLLLAAVTAVVWWMLRWRRKMQLRSREGTSSSVRSRYDQRVDSLHWGRSREGKA